MFKCRQMLKNNIKIIFILIIVVNCNGHKWVKTKRKIKTKKNISLKFTDFTKICDVFHIFTISYCSNKS